MKKLLFFFLAFCTLSIVGLEAQSNQPVFKDVEMPGPKMTFESTTVDYGTIDQSSEPLRVAKFTNTGDEPLVITNAKGSCGCTVPKWPKEPIMPGESAQIEIRYDTKRVGPINKTVKITTNEGGDPVVLKVIGKINAAAADEEAVPSAKPSLINPN